MKLFIGDDWASDHHDIEIQNVEGEQLVRERVPEGPKGITDLYRLIAGAAHSSDQNPCEVLIAIETSQGGWFETLIAAGFQVYPINPLSVARAREAYSPSGKKSDKFDAHVLANIVRNDAGEYQQSHSDSEQARALKILTRSHQKLVGDRTREINRLKDQLRQSFPAAIAALDTLGIASDDALTLLLAAPTPTAAQTLTDEEITTALKAAHRRKIAGHLTVLRAAFAEPALPQLPMVAAAHAQAITAICRVILALNEAIAALEKELTAVFRQHPAADIYTSMPGVADLSGARLLAEYGDDPTRFCSSGARRNYAGMTPITAASGKHRSVKKRKAFNRFLASATRQWAFNSLAASASPECKRFYDEQRARGISHEAALRNIGAHLTSDLDACLRTGQPYDPIKAWRRYQQPTNETSPAAA